MPGDVAGDGARGDPVHDGYGSALAAQALNARAASWVTAGLSLRRHLDGQRQHQPG